MDNTNTITKPNVIDKLKHYLDINRESIYSNAIKAEDIHADDEWMQEDIWDKIHDRKEKALRRPY